MIAGSAASASPGSDPEGGGESSEACRSFSKLLLLDVCEVQQISCGLHHAVLLAEGGLAFAWGVGLMRPHQKRETSHKCLQFQKAVVEPGADSARDR